eukprot:Plantae.Rhodophyta-Purpureofilum_apyrenoidigerum.ctg1277.p2 GENE.Plantae.Rhodophyta-Purpureofilum_apyrenoidigerum.ctg1277~~Plantae.Rhodophyta-Purpureofilum_apyrenoidigerum.ctg1277.p2  ORF type:complete len:188 (+),score=46.97 Plantae.Rhodophyta-Purpureofilum_apyrenoidigerum.ctg1277:183-746(+)
MVQAEVGATVVDPYGGTATVLNKIDGSGYNYYPDHNVRRDETNLMADVPDRGKEALHDLYRFSQKLGEKLRAPVEDNLDRTSTQGPLFIKVKWFHMWKKRFGSVANHAQYGPVLFLFAYDKDGTVDLKNSQMIALADSSVRLGRNVKSSDGKFKCEFILNTHKKRHVFAARDAITRDYWIASIRKLA